jgi:hypothetical protein
MLLYVLSNLLYANFKVPEVIFATAFCSSWFTTEKVDSYWLILGAFLLFQHHEGTQCCSLRILDVGGATLGAGAALFIS